MLLESAFCFQLFTYFLEKVVALCSIMEFPWNQISAIENRPYIELYIEKSIRIKIFTFKTAPHPYLLPRSPASRSPDAASESSGTFCWVSGREALAAACSPYRSAVVRPSARPPGGPAELPHVSPGWSGGSGHRLHGGPAGLAVAAAAGT